MGQPQHDSDLERFLEAQDPIYSRVLEELRGGRKASHWMWFIFPQLRGLGSSSNAQFFGISGRSEAEAYLRHPILGPRLKECTVLVSAIERSSVSEIFGYPDDLKFKSSMTLFASVAPKEQVFRDALDRYFGGELDRLTLRLL